MTEIANRITPAEVTRDECGFWSHPELPNFDEDAQAYLDWLDAQQLETYSISFEFDAPDELITRWYGEGDPNCSDWKPEKPEGKGWFMLGIWDGDDGPWCVWVRYAEDAGRHAPTPAPAVPEGWQIVPVKPTPEMLDKGLNMLNTWGFNTPEEIYSAMLSAAPKYESGAA